MVIRDEMYYGVEYKTDEILPRCSEPVYEWLFFINDSGKVCHTKDLEYAENYLEECVKNRTEFQLGFRIVKYESRETVIKEV